MVNTHSPFSSVYQFSICLYTSLQIKLYRGHVTVFGGAHVHLAQEAWFAPSFVHLVEHMA